MTYAPDDAPNANRGPHRFLGVPHWLIVAFLTIVAAALRFTALDKPAIWGDEAATWRRISGSYPELVQELRLAGFMPTHYLLTWWIKDGFPYYGEFVKPSDASLELRRRSAWRTWRRDPPAVATPEPTLEFRPTHRLIDGGITPTPFVMRFVPALCGTLMVPAMYFLASQLVARRTALLAALFTCCSAYMLGYSRDAKMYAQFWFFVTLHVGCLFWWLSAYRLDALALVAVKPKRFSKQDELGVGVAGVLPGAHVGHIARAFIADAELGDPIATATRLAQPPSRLNTLVRWACWITSGLAMIAFHAIGLAVVGIELLILIATAPHRARYAVRMIVGLASPILYFIDRGRERAVLRGTGVSPVFVYGRDGNSATRDGDAPGARFRGRVAGLHLPPLIGFLIGAIAICALWNSYRSFTKFYETVLPDPAANRTLQVDYNDAGVGWVEPYNAGRSAASMFLYNATAYLMSWEWPKPDDVVEVNPRAFKYLSRTATVLLIAIAAGALPWRQAIAAFRGDRRTLHERGPMPFAACFLIAAWLLVPAYGLYIAGGAWSEGGKVRALSPVEATVAAYRPVEEATYSRPRVAASAADTTLPGALARELRPATTGERTWSESWTALRALPWRTLFEIDDAPLGPPRSSVVDVGGASWTSLVVTAPLDRYVPRGTILLTLGALAVIGLIIWRAGPLVVLGWLVRGAAVVVVLFALLLLVYVAVPMQEKSVWMPRYAGFIWPAFAIGVSVLIRRLPLLPMRWGVVLLLIGANLTNFVMRCKYGEPPTAAIAADILKDRDRPESRFFGSVIPKQFGGPGTGSIFTLPSYYYLSIQSGKSFTPSGIWTGAFRDAFDVPRYDGELYAGGVRATLRRAPSVDAFDLWVERYPDVEADEARSRLANVLGPAWQPAEPAQRRMIYDHWTWREMYILERHHWRRIERPATAPATTRPTTRSTSRPATRPARRSTTP